MVVANYETIKEKKIKRCFNSTPSKSSIILYSNTTHYSKWTKGCNDMNITTLTRWNRIEMSAYMNTYGNIQIFGIYHAPCLVKNILFASSDSSQVKKLYKIFPCFSNNIPNIQVFIPIKQIYMIDWTVRKKTWKNLRDVCFDWNYNIIELWVLKNCSIFSMNSREILFYFILQYNNTFHTQCTYWLTWDLFNFNPRSKYLDILSFFSIYRMTSILPAI